MVNLKKLKEQRAAYFTQLEELRKACDGRDMTAEERVKWDKLQEDYDGADARCSQEDRFNEILRRQIADTSSSSESRSENAESEVTADIAFRSLLANGVAGMSEDEKIALRASGPITGTDGTILVPKNLASKIEVALKAYGGMLETSTIITTTNGGDLIMPTVNHSATKAKIVGEYAKNTTNKIDFSNITLKAYTYRTNTIPLSLELLQDSAFNIEELVARLLSDSFGRGLNEHLTIGTGTDQPKGIVTAAFGSLATPLATSIKLDDILDLMAGLDSSYDLNARFMLNKKTLFALRKIKNGNGDYIWKDSNGEFKASLCGKPYTLNNDMPDIGAGKASVLYGDLSKYQIRQVKGFNILRLNETLLENLSIGIFGYARFDGNLLDAGTKPVHKLVHAAS